MDVLAVLLLIIILIVILTFKSSLFYRLRVLEEEIARLRQHILHPPAESKPVEQPAKPVAPAETKPANYWETGFKKIEEDIPVIPQPIPEKQQEASIPAPIEKKPIETIVLKETITTAPKQVVPEPEPSFFERHPDIEKFIGENLINKIGIAILVLAIGFFVKYAIDKNWIGPLGRVAIGVLCGGILVGVAHRLRSNYKAFSSVLVGGGLAVFYFTIALAYHQFHLFSQATSFVIMIVITIFAVALSLLYNRQELAIIALVGGFVTPFLVSDGSNNYIVLFSYLLVLNTGLVIIAYNRAWRLLNILAFIFTVILFGSWAFTLSHNLLDNTYRNGLLFATAFYLLYFIINIANNIKENKKFIASDFGILLLNNSFYFAAGLFFISMMNAVDYRGLFCASLGVFNLAASYFLFRKQTVDRNILYLLIGLTLTFVSLTAPIQLHGHYITLFWASEAVLLYWLYQRSKISIIQVASLVVWIAMMGSLVLDWKNVYNDNSVQFPVIFNKGFITTLFAAVACYALFLLRRKDTDAGLHFIPVAAVYRITGIVLLYCAGMMEIRHQFEFAFPGTGISYLYLSLFSFAFVLLFVWISGKIKSLQTPWQVPAVLLSICLLAYFGSIEYVSATLRTMLTENNYRNHFAAHWINAILVALIIYNLIKIARDQYANSNLPDIISWLLCTAVVVFLSAETYLLSNNIFYTNPPSWFTNGDVFVRTGLPILWGLCSFAFMWLGMHHKFRTLRIISLTLFSITLIKLFVYDISDIPAGGKIAAFFCLGVLLLVVSFMYQRLKRIIIEDEKKPHP